VDDLEWTDDLTVVQCVHIAAVAAGCGYFGCRRIEGTEHLGELHVVSVCTTIRFERKRMELWGRIIIEESENRWYTPPMISVLVRDDNVGNERTWAWAWARAQG
jgi:hypothetical protein